MRLLVTGGAGFIGANFVRLTRQVHPDVNVVVLDALTYAGNESSLAEVRDDIEFVRGDVADAAVIAAGREGPELHDDAVPLGVDGTQYGAAPRPSAKPAQDGRG